MSLRRARQRLIWHGIFLFFLGLLTGFLVPVLTSARLGVSAHLEALLNGMFLVLIGGVVWNELRLSGLVEAAGFWLLLLAAYGNWAFCLLAAAFGASQMLPIAGAGHGASEWQEQLIRVGLTMVASCIVIAVCFLLYGLRGGSGEEVRPSDSG